MTFDIKPTLGWEAETNTTGTERKRQADVYVVALLAHRDKITLDPLNIVQWQFYVLTAAILNTQLPLQKTISLTTLQRLGARQVPFENITEMIDNTKQAGG
jgi:hypothetical protein